MPPYLPKSELSCAPQFLKTDLLRLCLSDYGLANYIKIFVSAGFSARQM